MTNRQVKSPRSRKTSKETNQTDVLDPETTDATVNIGSAERPKNQIRSIDNLKYKSTEIQKEPWIADPLQIKRVTFDDKGFHYELIFQNFLGGTTSIMVDRADCFVNFTKVIALLAAGGYNYDVNNPKALDAIRTYLTAIHVEPEELKRAAKAKEEQIRKTN